MEIKIGNIYSHQNGTNCQIQRINGNMITAYILNANLKKIREKGYPGEGFAKNVDGSPMYRICIFPGEYLVKEIIVKDKKNGNRR